MQKAVLPLPNPPQLGLSLTHKLVGNRCPPEAKAFGLHCNAPFMGHRYVAPPFTACPEWSERGGAGIDFPNRPFLKMWVRLSQLGEEALQEASI